MALPPELMTEDKWTTARFVRLVIFFLTAGFAYPHVMTEGLDLAAQDLYYRNKK
jgi:hypothetical protein